MGPKVLILLCLTIALELANCELKSSRDDERARLPEFLTELDLASLEASQEDIEAIKTVVKRLAPEKNGEYQVYQVFFGNEELLKEWLKGAGVMGQPGVDFPALTTIPTTTFSCRGLKGGYYADLETNCQVFHICDNGRKISFLCPNGTIFQQSQLICDWWFKVDCSKSAELYEQSAEQLAEDERKRAEAKRINSEFHRANNANEENNGQNYYQTQNSNYDGRQNGRTNPFGQAPNKNHITESSGQRSTDTKANNQSYDPNQTYSGNAVTPSQYNQINDLADANIQKKSQEFESTQSTNNYKSRQQQASQSAGRTSSANYRGTDRQQNQLIEVANEEAKPQSNYESRGANKYSGSNNYKNQQQPTQSNQQSVDYSNRNAARDGERRSYAKSSSVVGKVPDHEQSSNRATPSYTETTTFRTSTPSPIREYQQFAESAAFASNRGNRFNEAYSSSQFNTYFNHNYNNHDNANENKRDESKTQQKTTEKPRQKSITPKPGTEKTGGNVLRVRVGQPAGFSTLQPVYKPHANDRNSEYESTTLGTTSPDVVITTHPYTDDSSQDNQDGTSNSDNVDCSTSRSVSQDSEVTAETTTTELYAEDYGRNSVTPGNDRTIGDFFENTTPTIISAGTYISAEAYTNSAYTSDPNQPKQTPNNRKTPPSVSSPGTTKTYSKFQDYGQSSAVTASYVATANDRREVTRDRSGKSQDNQQGRTMGKSTQRPTSSYRTPLNSISTSTEKPMKSLATTGLAQSGFTGKTLSPYDTSITYQQGKVMSTLGPYVPFTKNYAYSTPTTSTTTSKSPVYTATVPIYSTIASIYRSSSPKSHGTKLRVSAASAVARPTGRLPSGSAAYLPEKKSDAYLAKKHSLEERPLNEREHAMSMLQSLRGLEDAVPSAIGISNGTRTGLTVPMSSGPSTLHSLALYFATAGDDFDATAETRQETSTEATENRRSTDSPPKEENVSIELPKSILTQNTINSYADLFNLNNALEGNSSSKSGLDVDPDSSTEDKDDLDIQQSQGPVDGVRKSNGTKLRELAQVFTHALSAYLQDPDTFKRILTEIRPTEPSINSDEEYGTTLIPTTLEDYPSVTKEKDEVLDFSDDTAPHRVRRPTTIYPATTTDPSVTTQLYDQPEYYTTTSNYYTTLRQESDVTDTENNFAFQVNNAFGTITSSENGATSVNVYYPEEASGPSGTSALDRPEKDDPLNDYGDNYFPNDESNKLGGFQNNTRTTYQPYGKHVKPFDATPISDNYVSSSTPATYIASYNSRISGYGKDIDQTAGEPKKTDNAVSVEGNRRGDESKRDKSTSQPFRIRYYESTTTLPRGKDQESLVTAGSAYSGYRKTGNDLVNGNVNVYTGNYATSRTAESLTTAAYTDSTNRDEGSTSTMSPRNEPVDRQNPRNLNDHWTSSPAVTQLWESTVFVDPKRINQGLVSGLSQDPQLSYSTIDYPDSTDPPVISYGNSSAEKIDDKRENFATDRTSSEVSETKTTKTDDPSSSWSWSSIAPEEDSPTSFTLLPKAIQTTSDGNIGTATPTPIYTTRSSITTTITSSVTSTTSSGSSGSGLTARQSTASPLSRKNTSSRPKHAIPSSLRENEVVRANEMFGKLNDTSTDTLMRVMKQADTNATVRQLVLLLINHCKGPMNKTMEEEKEQLLDALLRMPVNQFTSEESRDLVAGINNIKLPIGKEHFTAEATSSPFATRIPSTTTEEPIVTTFRSKKGRRLKNKLDATSRSGQTRKRNEDTGESSAESNALSSEDTSASDARALELLRSLYTIAAKWG